MCFSCCDDVIVRLILLEHKPHGLHILFRIAPVALGIEIAEVEFVLESSLYVSCSAGYLSRHKGFPAARRLVVEKYSVAGKYAVTFAIIDCHPVGVDFRGCVRTAWVERSRLTLGYLLGASEHLRTTGLIKLRLQSGLSNRF